MQKEMLYTCICRVVKMDPLLQWIFLVVKMDPFSQRCKNGSINTMELSRCENGSRQGIKIKRTGRPIRSFVLIPGSSH